MSDNFPTPEADNSFDVIMETLCPTTNSRCKWTVKDFTKYPLEEIISHLFDLNETDVCEFALKNFAKSDAAVCPEFCVKYYSEERVYATFKIVFYDSKREELYKMEKTKVFGPPKRRDFQMKGFPQKKLLEMEEDTVIIECEMEILRPVSILHTEKFSSRKNFAEDQRSQSSLIATSEDEKSQSPLPASSEDEKSQSPLTAPAEDQRSQSPLKGTSEDEKSQSPLTATSEDEKSQSPLTATSEDEKSQSPLTATAEDQRSQSSIASPSKDSGI